jgi:phytoene synthase
LSDALIAASRASIARGSKSFALASRLFGPVLRDRATLLYAWCRYADDVIDGQDAGFGRVEHAGTPAERLAVLEARTRAALAGEISGNPAYDALDRVAAETAMPDRYPLDLIEGFRIDVDDRRFVTFDDTLTYAYHVAGCVGVMMAIAMGVSSEDRATLDRACDLGMAFQLNNIARDVIEDAANGRCYLPEDWLAEAGLSRATFAAPANRAALAGVVARLVNTAERYEASSRFGTPALTRRAAWAVLAAADIYGGIGRRVRAGSAAALDRRVTTSRIEKLLAVDPAAGAYPRPEVAGSGTISRRTLDDASLIRPPPLRSSFASNSRTGGA